MYLKIMQVIEVPKYFLYNYKYIQKIFEFCLYKRFKFEKIAKLEIVNV